MPMSKSKASRSVRMLRAWCPRATSSDTCRSCPSARTLPPSNSTTCWSRRGRSAAHRLRAQRRAIGPAHAPFPHRGGSHDHARRQPAVRRRGTRHCRTARAPASGHLPTAVLPSRSRTAWSRTGPSPSSVPIPRAAHPPYRFADASELHRPANPDSEYGLLLSAGAQRMLDPAAAGPLGRRHDLRGLAAPLRRHVHAGRRRRTVSPARPVPPFARRLRTAHHRTQEGAARNPGTAGIGPRRVQGGAHSSARFRKVRRCACGRASGPIPPSGW